MSSRDLKYLGTALTAALALTLAGCTAGDSNVTGAASTADTEVTSENAQATADAGSQAALTAAPSADVQPPMETEDPEPQMATGAPEVTQDFEDDAGADLEEYEYPDGPAPAESVVATLCNLNRDYFSSLSTSSSGADGDLRMSALGLSDVLGYWETLVPSYPDVADDVATAGAIATKWDDALLARDNGDEAAATAALDDADDLIASLPAATDVDCVP